jgi:hypothetical protein
MRWELLDDDVVIFGGLLFYLISAIFEEPIKKTLKEIRTQG